MRSSVLSHFPHNLDSISQLPSRDICLLSCGAALSAVKLSLLIFARTKALKSRRAGASSPSCAILRRCER